MLGYDPTNSVATTNNGVATGNEEFGSVSPDFIMDDVQCTGHEANIFQCSRRLEGHNCGPSEGAGVRCVPNIELVGGSNEKEGNVLLYGSPIW